MRMSRLVTALGSCAFGATGLFWPWLPGGHDRGMTLHGTVEIQEVRLGARIGGRVAEVLVREGDLVQSSQVLVRLDVPELAARCEQSEARMRAMAAARERAARGARPEEKEAARAAVLAARARYERLRAGPRPEEVRQAKAEVRREEASLSLARKELNRNESLAGRNAVSPTDRDASEAEYGRTLARVEVTRARLALLMAGNRKEEVAEAAAELQRAQANAAVLENGTRAEEVAQAEAALAEARGRLNEDEARLREASVLAPERAVVEVVSVRRGDVVAPDQTIVRVLSADDLWVRAYVPETELGRVRLGQGVHLTVDSHPGRRFAGTVVQIAAESEFTPRNVQSAEERRHQVFAVKVRVADRDGVFKSGMAAEVFVPPEPASREGDRDGALAQEGKSS